MIKYKLGFTIDSEVMFMLLSKFLPIQDLSVEEVVVPVPDPAIRFDKQFDLPKPKRKPKLKGIHRRSGGPAADLTHGVNAIIMDVLADRREHKRAEIVDAVAKTTYAVNGVGSKLARLLDYGVIQKAPKGIYSLTPKGMEATKPKEEVA